MKEFNLSEKIKHNRISNYCVGDLIFVSDVKDFIKRLKDFVVNHQNLKLDCVEDLLNEIDKLAGERLK